MANAFFSSGEVEQIASDHIEKILGMEDDEAQAVLDAYSRIRGKLRDRLDALPSGTFTEQRTRGALAQIESALEAMQKSLLKEMKSAAKSIGEEGVSQLFDELNTWNEYFTGAVVPINVDAVAVAADNANFLFNRYEASLSSYSESLRAKFAQSLMDSAIAQDSMGDVVQNISKSFLGEEWRLQRIVRTELHNVYNQAKLRGMSDVQENDMPDLMKTLFHPMDNRTGKDSKRLAQNNPIVPIDEPFVENSTGKKLTYMAPPNRPNDRAILIPYRTAWKK